MPLSDASRTAAHSASPSSSSGSINRTSTGPPCHVGPAPGSVVVHAREAGPDGDGALSLGSFEVGHSDVISFAGWAVVVLLVIAACGGRLARGWLVTIPLGSAVPVQLTCTAAVALLALVDEDWLLAS